MEKDDAIVGEVFGKRGIEFSFPNLKNLAGSDITYPQFLACVAQRLLLKQYAAQTMDTGNVLCSMEMVSDIFNKNKASFSVGINDLFLKPATLSVINAQTSKNKLTEEEQASAAFEFVKWYDSFWFKRLKSEELLTNLEEAFKGSSLEEAKNGKSDWETLAEMYSGTKETALFDALGIDSRIFTNKADAMEPRWFDDALGSLMKFMEATGDIDLQKFSGFVSEEGLIVPSTSAFMMSTVYGIEEVEEKKKRYNAPLDPYNMFYIFRETGMSHLLRMNQLLFTLYNYMKILL